MATQRLMVDTVAIPRIELLVECEAGKPTSRVVVIDGEMCRLGSHTINELYLDDRLVSRFHCRLVRQQRGWRIEDSGSLNGTFVGGVRVRDADLPLPECQLQLGNSRVRVRELVSGGAADVPVWPSFGSLFGSSLAMRRLFGVLEKVARSDANVLVEGESGTGKELVATELVRTSNRADGPFIIVDCSSIPPQLIESELFGHVRGAFTGADRDRTGALRAADGGTLFLDEIGEMPLEMQPKLLRFLESKEVRRVGETRASKVDVRIIAATNRNLEREVNRGRFREDLYFRLQVVSIHVPPLRDRLEDIPMLVRVFLDALGATHAASLFTADVLTDMQSHDWPGNVRELRNYVERAVVLRHVAPASGGSLRSQPPPDTSASVDIDTPFSVAKEQVVAGFERAYLLTLLEWAEGNVSRAARKAGMDRMHLHRLLQRHNIKSGSVKE